ncbi:MAG: MurR/RpiR family transcriptional regulator [Limnohabitans sp.]
MTTRLTLAIQEHFEQLTPSERKLASLLLEHADDMLTYSATELTAMAEVSKATGARLFRSLGYADFNEVRLQAREERNLAPPYAQETKPRLTPPRVHTIASHLLSESESLSRTFESLRTDTLATAADQLAKAPRVWLLGLGMDAGLVQFVQPQLARIRPDVHTLGMRGGLWAEDLAMTGPRDSLLLVMTQPRLKLIERLAAHAATTRVEIVSVVDIRQTSWAQRISKVVLPCYCASSEHAYSAMAATSMLHLLTQNISVKLGKRAGQRQQVVDDINRELESE